MTANTPDASKQLVVVPDREPLTELEFQRLTLATQKLERLRALHKDADKSSGYLVVGGGPMAKSVALASYDLQAAFSLLIERYELEVSSYNVKIERPE